MTWRLIIGLSLLLPAAMLACCDRSATGQVVQIAGRGSLANGRGDEETVPVVELVLHPAAQPRRALQYQLLPGVLKRRPGNAAVMYNKIALRMLQGNLPEKAEKVEEHLDTPLADLPQAEVEEALRPFRGVIDDLALAARREHCDWQLPIREKDFIGLLLPEVGHMRRFARLLVVQARLQIARGQFEEALDSIQTGFAMARHVAEGPTLVNGLVGMAVVGVMAEELETLIQQPGAPNLYWALTALPRPVIDLRKATETEMQMLYLSFPELAEIDDTTHGVAYWQVFLDRIATRIGEWEGSDSRSRLARVAMTLLAVKAYPLGREMLIEQGRTPEEVDAMPVPQVVVLYTIRTYEELRDETFKWFHVEYPAAHAGMKAAEDALRRNRHREVFPLASMMLPAVSSCRTAQGRTDRTIAVLRTLEALRLHAAGHQGHLPKSLADITTVPVPDDPLTGQPFAYRLEGTTAHLEAVLPEGLRPQRYGLRYAIKVAP